MSDKKRYVWCTYREWSFKILEALQDLEGWETGLIVTTHGCIYDFTLFEKRGIPVLKVLPEKAKQAFQKGGEAYEMILGIRPETIITPGWSWYVPDDILNYCPCVTYHPGKLPGDRGGSPIQNQIRHGEAWTYVNVMKQEKGLDEGPVYLKQKISLEGSADDVWRRMTSAGVVLTREYLKRLAAGPFEPEPQEDDPPAIYKRVKPEDAELKPVEQSAVEMLNIIRAHAENDVNGYVVPAYLVMSDHLKLEIYRASLDTDSGLKTVTIDLSSPPAEEIHQWVHQVNNNEIRLVLNDADSAAVYLSQVNVRLM